MIDWKNFNWKEALPFTTILLVVLYISAYFVKIGEMLFFDYPFSLFKFSTSDVLLYSLKPLFLISLVVLFSFTLKITPNIENLQSLVLVLALLVSTLQAFNGYFEFLKGVDFRIFLVVLWPPFIMFALNLLAHFTEVKTKEIKMSIVIFMIIAAWVFILFLNRLPYYILLIFFIPIGLALVISAVIAFNVFRVNKSPIFLIFLAAVVVSFMTYSGATYNLLSKSFLITTDGRIVTGIYDDSIILKSCHDKKDSFKVVNPTDENISFLNLTFNLSDYLSFKVCE